LSRAQRTTTQSKDLHSPSPGVKVPFDFHP